MVRTIAAVLALGIASVQAHYIFPSLIVGNNVTGAWQYVRTADNRYSNGPVTDVKSLNFRCYNSQNLGAAKTATVSAGSQVGINSGGTVSHPGVLNMYMAKAPDGVDVADWDGAGDVWFKVYEIPAKTGGGAITWPSSGVAGYKFNLPKDLPSGQYLMRTEHIALHSAGSLGGAQFYISCAQLEVVDGGNGKPGPLVAIPGVYDGNEPGIKINIYYPIPTSYTQPGPPVWS